MVKAFAVVGPLGLYFAGWRIYYYSKSTPYFHDHIGKAVLFADRRSAEQFFKTCPCLPIEDFQVIEVET